MQTPKADDSSQSPQFRSRLSWRERLFFPLIAIAVAFGISAYRQQPPPHPATVSPPNSALQSAQFEILVSELAKDRQRIELLEESFDYWSKRTVSRQFINLKPDSWQKSVLKAVPGLPAMLDNLEWNRSTADVMLHCRPSVEFEISFENPKDWRIRIIGDTAVVEAANLEVDEPLIPTDSIENFVIEEEFWVDGKKEAERLQRMLSEDVKSHTSKPEFLTPERRELCRRNLEKFLLNLFRATDRTKLVRHVYVSFPGEPPFDSPTLSPAGTN